MALRRWVPLWKREIDDLRRKLVAMADPDVSAAPGQVGTAPPPKPPKPKERDE